MRPKKAGGLCLPPLLRHLQCLHYLTICFATTVNSYTDLPISQPAEISVRQEPRLPSGESFGSQGCSPSGSSPSNFQGKITHNAQPRMLNTFFAVFLTPNAERSTLNAFPPSPQVGAVCGVLSAEFSNLFVAVLTPHSEPSTPHSFPPSPQGRVGTSWRLEVYEAIDESPSPQGRVKVGCGVRCAECGVSTSSPLLPFSTPHSDLPKNPTPSHFSVFKVRKMLRSTASLLQEWLFVNT